MGRHCFLNHSFGRNRVVRVVRLADFIGLNAKSEGRFMTDVEREKRSLPVPEMAETELREARMKKILTEERAEPEQWFYLSFADEEFNGAVIIRAHGIADATMKTHVLGINPGGQVISVPIPTKKLPAETYRNRLLSKADIVEFWPDSKTIREHEEEAQNERT